MKEPKLFQFLKPGPFGLVLKILLALACVLSVFISSRSAIRDLGDFQYNSANEGSRNFHQFWNSARYLLEGYNIYDPAVFKNLHLDAPYIPDSFVFFFPFVPLGVHWGKILWLALNLLFTVLLARQISGLFWNEKHFYTLFALIACSAPWAILIHFGQCTLWSFCFFLLALQWDRERRPILSGLAIAFCLLKYFLTAPLLLYFLVYRRSWKNVAIGAGIHLVVFSAFCVHLKMSPWDLFLAPLHISEVFGAGQYGYLDLDSFWTRVTKQAMGPEYLLSTLLVTGAWLWLLNRYRGKDDLGFFTLTVMTALTIAYHNIYDYLGAIFPLVWFLKRFAVQGGRLVLAVGIVALWVLYVSSHYFEFFSHMRWTMDFIQSNGYLIFLSLLWYLALGLLWFQLKADESGTAPQSNKTIG